MNWFIGFFQLLMSTIAFGQLQETTTEQDQKFIARFVHPKPGLLLEIPSEQITNFGPTDHQRGRLFGFVSVSPPKGQCFTIMTHPMRQDHEVCKPTQIKWFLSDIDPNLGTIQWNIKWKPDQSYVPVTWNTNYRVAKFLGSGKTIGKDQSTNVYIQNCQAIKTAENRSVKLKTFSEGTWTLRFPAQDSPIPTAQAPVTSAVTPQPADATTKLAEKDTKPIEEAKKELWTMATRRGFVMNSSSIYPSMNRPAGGPGTCRYQYDTVIGNFANGRMECKDGASFTYFYVPLSCIAELKP